MLINKVSLRVRSSVLSLYEIIELIGPPTHGFSVGELYGKSYLKRRKHTQWTYSYSGDEQNLAIQINELLELLEDRQINNLYERCTIDIFCFVTTDNGQGGTTLDRKTLQRLAISKVDLTFDVYSEVDT